MTHAKTKALFLVIDPTVKELAPPTMEERAAAMTHGLPLPTARDIEQLDTLLGRINETAAMLRGAEGIDVGFVTFTPGQAFVAKDPGIFNLHIESYRHNQSAFYGVVPQQGDWLIGKSNVDIHHDPGFPLFLLQEGYTHVYKCGFQASRCLLASALRKSAPPAVQELLAPIRVAVVGDLSANTHLYRGALGAPPPPEVAAADFARHKITLITADDLKGHFARPQSLRQGHLPGFHPSP